MAIRKINDAHAPSLAKVLKAVSDGKIPAHYRSDAGKDEPYYGAFPIKALPEAELQLILKKYGLI